MMSLPRLKLISFKLCPYVQRSYIVLREKDAPFDIEYIDLDNKPAWFEAISPLSKVPVLMVDDQPLFESIPICEYLDDIVPGESMHPGDPLQRAFNKAWIEYANDILVNQYQMFITDNDDQFIRSRDYVRKRFAYLDEHINPAPYFNGERFCIIDAVFGPLFAIYQQLNVLTGANWFTLAGGLEAYANALLARPSVQQCLPQDYRDELKRYLLTKKSVMASKFIQ